MPVDAGLPKNAAWVASFDAGAILDLCASPAFAELANKILGIDPAMINDLGIDRTGTIRIAQLGLSDAEKSALSTLLARRDGDIVDVSLGQLSVASLTSAQNAILTTTFDGKVATTTVTTSH